MNRLIRVGLLLIATVLTTQANACWWSDTFDCVAVNETLNRESDEMIASCEGSSFEEEWTCNDATGRWNDTYQTWADHSCSSGIVIRRVW